MLIPGRSFFAIKSKQTYKLMDLKNHITFQMGIVTKDFLMNFLEFLKSFENLVTVRNADFWV